MRRVVYVLAFLASTAFLFAVGTGGGGSSSGGSASSTTSASSTPSTALEWYKVGYKASDAGNYQEAANDFQKAIALKPDYAEAYNMLGFATRKMNDLTNAFIYYDKALQLKPNFPEVREYLGEAYLQQGDLTKAVQQYLILQKGKNKNAAELLEKIDAFVNPKS